MNVIKINVYHVREVNGKPLEDSADPPRFPHMETIPSSHLSSIPDLRRTSSDCAAGSLRTAVSSIVGLEPARSSHDRVRKVQSVICLACDGHWIRDGYK